MKIDKEHARRWWFSYSHNIWHEPLPVVSLAAGAADFLEMWDELETY